MNLAPYYAPIQSLICVMQSTDTVITVSLSGLLNCGLWHIDGLRVIRCIPIILTHLVRLRKGDNSMQTMQIQIEFEQGHRYRPG